MRGSIYDDDFVRVRKGVTPHSGRRLRVSGWGDNKRFVNLRVPTATLSDNILVYDADEVERIKRVRDRYEVARIHGMRDNLMEHDAPSQEGRDK